ncbi:HAMP domain-containing sensor histidine kinase [Bacillus paramycoides]|uniref:sensor histidine kinase n=1 Tax=Bacillus paramycoides TaxID=2026194 RepID=UPI002E1BE550|nr:HAMP domain-containing sensor histidine kinase [Bacillus paramycoides]MED0986288.1 HAMP domain-containing sensor histidine kinase [Bacillus paramycoides]MED1103500.1 HAMP domain-containing sensor histidine kinase [Bacillus paramycoides]
MKLKKKYQLLLFSAIISVPLLLLSISILVSVIYNVAFKTKNKNIPFHDSFAYPTMLVIFLLSLLVLAFLFSKSIHSLLNKINVLNQTIRDLASDKKIPNIIDVKSDDEMGKLIKSVNLLIERTTYRELELQQQEQIKKELLNKLRHDINTPLTAVRLQLYYLEGQYEEQAPILESLYEQIQYISDLTNEFNIQSTETLENAYIVNDDVNINNLLENMIRKWSYLYSIHEIKLVYSSKDKGLIWNSNELWIQRLFDNIFQNVLKHSQAEKFEIIIDNNAVSFRDNGVGFDINSKSLGIGLKNIEDISRMFDIKYTLQSNSNGTMFSFENIQKKI